MMAAVATTPHQPHLQSHVQSHVQSHDGLHGGMNHESSQQEAALESTMPQEVSVDDNGDCGCGSSFECNSSGSHTSEERYLDNPASLDDQASSHGDCSSSKEDGPVLRNISLKPNPAMPQTPTTTSSSPSQSRSELQPQVQLELPLQSHEEHDDFAPRTQDDRNERSAPQSHNDDDFARQQREEELLPKPLYVPDDSLYGRQIETQILQESLMQFASNRRDPEVLDGTVPRTPQFILVAGRSGLGKSKLVRSLREFATAADTINGYFCVCKFDQMDEGYAACPMTQALTSYAAQVLKRGEKAVRDVRNRIVNAFGNEAIIQINRLIPAMADILGEPDLPPMGALASNPLFESMAESVSAAMGTSSPTLNIAADTTGAMAAVPNFKTFFRAVCTAENPLILVLDDLQWACEVLIGELEPLITDPDNKGLLLIGTTRDDVPTDSLVPKMMRRLDSKGADLCTIELAPLHQPIVQEIVHDVFRLPPAPATALANFIFTHSEGSPLFIVEIIRWINEEYCFFQYDQRNSTWIVLRTAVQCSTCSPSGMIERRLDSLPGDMQKVLTVVACLRTHAYEHLIRFALQEDIDDSIQGLVDKGMLIVDDTDDQRRFYFRHDRIQQASYDLIPEDLRPAYHLEIALRLMRSLDVDELDHHLLVVLAQMTVGVHLITDETQRREMSALCIRAAEKATNTSSIRAASQHLQLAFDLLGDDPWHQSTYELSLVLHKYAAEVEFSIQDSPRVDQLLDDILINARNFDDKVGAYITKIHVLITRCKTNLAIQTAVDVLAQLGVNIPMIRPDVKSDNRKLKWKFLRMKHRLKSRSDQSIKRIPHMTDPRKLASMQILNLLFLTTWMNRPCMFGFVVLKMVKLTLDDGLSAMASVAFAGFGSLLCYMLQIKEGVRYGKLCLDLLEQFQSRAYMSRCYAFVYGMIFAYTRPWEEILEPLLTGQRVGLQSGDTQFANFDGYLHALFLLDGGKVHIDVVMERLQELTSMEDFHNNFKELGLHCLVEGMRKLHDPNSDLLDHSGILDDKLEYSIANNKIYCLRLISCVKAFLALIGGDPKRALMEADQLAPWTERKDGIIYDRFGFTVEATACFRLARTTKGSERKNYIRRGKSRVALIKKLAASNPYQCLAISSALDAEILALKKRHSLAYDKYQHAIALADRIGCIYEVGTTNEMLGRHYIDDLKNRTLGKDHLGAAARAYTQYGAHAYATVIHKLIEKLDRESS